jgi:hypothetical protein
MAIDWAFDDKGHIVDSRVQHYVDELRTKILAGNSVTNSEIGDLLLLLEEYPENKSPVAKED